MHGRRIAVLGAGPVGLEAALQASGRGGDVRIYEENDAGASVEAWGHVTLFSPFDMNSTPLGRQTLRDRGIDLPGDGEYLTGREYRARYLLPLAESAPLAGRIETGTRVIQVTRDGLLKNDAIGEARRAAVPFRILLERDGTEREERADVVIDATGSYRNPNWIGPGGAPALGERAVREAVEYGLPDLTESGRALYAGMRVLLVGGGHSAATAALGLACLAREAPATSVVWATRSAAAEPIARIENDPLPRRDTLALKANALAIEPDSNISHWRAATVTELHPEGSGFRARFSTPGGAREERFDRIIANVGYQPDASLYRQLQVHECYATLGPMNLSAAILSASGGASGDCLHLGGFGPEALVNPEANFFILGMKSFGRNSAFLLRTGYEQVQDVLEILSRPAAVSG